MTVTLPSYDLTADILPFGESMVSWAAPALLLMAALAFGPYLLSAAAAAFGVVFGSSSGGGQTYEEYWQERLGDVDMMGSEAFGIVNPADYVDDDWGGDN